MKLLSSRMGYGLIFIYLIKLIILLFFVWQMYESAKDQTQRELQADLQSAILFIRQEKDEEKILELLNEMNESRASHYESSEYVVGELDVNENINFLIRGHERFLVPFGETTAGPMQRALKKESGIIDSFDYENTPVVAAYTYIEDLDWGLVFKIDTDEIGKPFVRISVFLISTYFIATIIGVWAWIKRSQYYSASIDKKNEQLIKTNEELEKFAYIASHDLKAPLRAIANLSEWIEDGVENPDEELKEYLALMRTRISRMQGLIEGILQYSRIGRTDIENKVVNLNALLEEVDDLLGDHSCNINYQENMPSVIFNKTRMTQVFMNLISNAIKYHDKPEGNIWVTYQIINDSHRFSVKDDGPGIKPEYQTKVFELFQTLQPRDQIESTGMGLTLTKKVLESYGGSIWVQSDGVSGTEFVFELPESLIVE